jgi:hypothetical protein
MDKRIILSVRATGLREYAELVRQVFKEDKEKAELLVHNLFRCLGLPSGGLEKFGEWPLDGFELSKRTRNVLRGLELLPDGTVKDLADYARKHNLRYKRGVGNETFRELRKILETGGFEYIGE